MNKLELAEETMREINRLEKTLQKPATLDEIDEETPFGLTKQDHDAINEEIKEIEAVIRYLTNEYDRLITDYRMETASEDDKAVLNFLNKEIIYMDEVIQEEISWADSALKFGIGVSDERTHIALTNADERIEELETVRDYQVKQRDALVYSITHTDLEVY